LYHIESTEIYTNAGYIALNLCERVDIFSTLGVTHMRLENNYPSLQLLTVNFVPTFSWSVGGRATLWECGCWGMGVEGQYFRTCPEVQYSLLQSDGSFFYPDHFATKYEEWQVGAGFSYTFRLHCSKLAMIPYLGVTWACSQLDLRGLSVDSGSTTATLGNAEASELWGYAAGITFTLAHMTAITVEGRFADTRGLYVNGQFRF